MRRVACWHLGFVVVAVMFSVLKGMASSATGDLKIFAAVTEPLLMYVGAVVMPVVALMFVKKLPTLSERLEFLSVALSEFLRAGVISLIVLYGAMSWSPGAARLLAAGGAYFMMLVIFTAAGGILAGSVSKDWRSIAIVGVIASAAIVWLFH